MSANPMGTNDDQIDRILSREDQILPSAGFTASVMAAVRLEASTPAPIPFPWKRAWPVLALASAAIVVVLIATVVIAVRLAAAPVSLVSMDGISILAQRPAWMSNAAIAWITGSLVLAFVSVKFSMRLAAR
jgi:hypothetical protein